MDDDEFAAYLAKLNPKAVIFLAGCSLGEGGAEAENLANKVASWASGRTVLSSKIAFTAFHLEIKSMYPFDIRVMDDEVDHAYRISNP